VNCGVLAGWLPLKHTFLPQPLDESPELPLDRRNLADIISITNSTGHFTKRQIALPAWAIGKKKPV
jgi:hypothetical protein